MGKKKGTSYFPVARIKKMMQADEDVGKIATTTPILVGKALECMIEDVLTAAANVAISRRAKTVQPAHLREAIDAADAFDFLRGKLAHVPKIDSAAPGPRVPRTPRTPKVAQGITDAEGGPAKRPRSPPVPLGGQQKKSKYADGMPAAPAVSVPMLTVGSAMVPVQLRVAAASSGGSGEDGGDDDEDYDEEEDAEEAEESSKDTGSSPNEMLDVEVPRQVPQPAVPNSRQLQSSIPCMSQVSSLSQGQSAGQTIAPTSCLAGGIAATSQPVLPSPRGSEAMVVSPILPVASGEPAFPAQLEGPPRPFTAPANVQTPLFTVPNIPLEPMRISGESSVSVPEKSKSASPKNGGSQCTTSDRVSVMSLLS